MSLTSGRLGFRDFLGQLFQRSDVRLLRIVLALLASASLVRAELSVTLEWEPSTDTNVIGYILNYGAVGGNAINAIDVGNQTTATVTNLFGGITNFFLSSPMTLNGCPACLPRPW